jgi:parallel beta-helix repeat protein
LVDLNRVRRASSPGHHRSRRRWQRVCLLAASSLLASPGLASGAVANPEVPLTASCGTVISDPLNEHPTLVLQNDVGPCSSTAITINASNVTLDLNGHTVFGNPQTVSGSTATSGFGEGAGIVLLGKRGVTITDLSAAGGGTVKQFDAGILIRRTKQKPATLNKVTKINLVDNVGHVVTGETTDFSDGIRLIGATSNTIQGNYFTQNGARAVGLDDGANSNTVKSNTITGNRSQGIGVLTFATGNALGGSIPSDGNTIKDNASSGINVSFDDANTVMQNNVIDHNGGNGARVSVASDGSVFKSNKITNNAQLGIGVAFSDNVSVEGNTVTGNGTNNPTTTADDRDGIQIQGATDPEATATNNVVKGNTVQNNARNGIMVDCMHDADTFDCVEYAQHNQVLSNTATGNGGASAGSSRFDLLDADPGNDCDSNVWSGNTFDTAFPACTTG